MKQKDKIKATKTYNITLNITEDGKSELIRRCDGFGAYELLGLLDLTRTEIIEQIRGKIQPDIIKREFIED